MSFVKSFLIYFQGKFVFTGPNFSYNETEPLCPPAVRFQQIWLDEESAASIIYLDIVKVFDLVNQHLLLTKSKSGGMVLNRVRPAAAAATQKKN